MNKNLISTALFFFTLYTLSGQTSVQFIYDNVGNRIQRSISVMIQVVSNEDETSIPETEIKVFPNPTEDVLYVEWHFPLGEGGIKAVLYDASGRQVLSTNLQSTITPIDIIALPSGVYWLTLVEDEKRIKQFQVVKK